MKLRNWVALASATTGAIGLGLIAKSFLPQHFATDEGYSLPEEVLSEHTHDQRDFSALPAVDVLFLRCGSQTIPEWAAVRGGSFSPLIISHSAVLVRHPRATFLYDTGLCTDIYTYLTGQSILLRKTLMNFVFEQSLSSHLERLGLKSSDLDFALLSHLHWDHVGGIPDIPGVPLYINRVEYEAATLGLLDAWDGLVRRLMGDNPLEFFDCAGPPFEGFRSSYDLFGDGSVVLVPLPGHTAGNTGMFINRSNGSPFFLLGDAVWVSENYARPATMHPLIWLRVTQDDATARQTLIQLHHYALQHPEIPLIAIHDAEMQKQFRP